MYEGSYNAGAPTRSLYEFRVLLMLCDELGFHLAQECFWYNPAKLPSPAEWVNVRRMRIKDSVEYVFWLSKEPIPKADNRKVLVEYSPDMRRLLVKGYRAKEVARSVRSTPKRLNGPAAAADPVNDLLGTSLAAAAEPETMRRPRGIHGTPFRKAKELVGLESEDCFALATYQIYQGIQKLESERLPYVFVVVGVAGLTGASVGAAIPAEE
jgi:hypothetical protein